MSLQSHHQTQRAMDILQSNTKGGREIELRKCPSDLLFHSFLPTRSPNTTQKQEQDGEEELNLGLSLGGRFGVDKSHKGLVRSSSLAGALPPARTPATLVRTASLPPETEEEWRKRKELQSLRRLEAKRKRSDKQQNPGRPGKPIPGSGYPVHWARSGDLQLQGLFVQQGKQVGSKGESLNLDPGRPGMANPGSGYPGHWANDSQGVVKSGDLQLQGLFVQQEKQVGSQGSSGVSQEESLNLDPGSGYPKSGSCGDLQDPFFQKQKQDGSQGSTSKSSSNASENEKETIQGSCCGARTAEVSSSKNPSSSGGGENGMGNMPCVFTVGDGPRGRRVEGILYRYKKGEEVRIMCICHGSFFTPAEFVNHSGAHNVAHPLKRIVVNPNVSPLS